VIGYIRVRNINPLMRVLQIAIDKSSLLQGFGMLQSRVTILQVGCIDTVGGASVTVSIMIISLLLQLCKVVGS